MEYQKVENGENSVLVPKALKPRENGEMTAVIKLTGVKQIVEICKKFAIESFDSNVDLSNKFLLANGLEVPQIVKADKTKPAYSMDEIKTNLAKVYTEQRETGKKHKEAVKQVLQQQNNG